MSIRPLGSEKLQGMDKIQRILEIARFKESVPSNIKENNNSEYKLTLADGNEYQIVKEKVGYIIKKTVSESTSEYIDQMKSRKYYPSYSQALKRLNLMAKETNTLFENKEGVSLFSEQKKFVLKNPNAEKKNPEPTSDVENVPPPAPEGPESGADMPPPPPAEGGEDMGGADMPPPPPAEGGEDMGSEMPPSPEGDDMGGEEHDEDVTFKTIQKLTGKLGQKLRTFSSKEDEKMSSKDIKYVINSILSALDIESLEDDDKEEIMSKFDGGEDMGDEDMGGDNGEEPPTDEMGTENPDDMGGEEEPTSGEESEGEMTEEDSPWVDMAKTGALNVMSNMITPGRIKQQEGEMVEDEDEGHIKRIADEMFVENKVENILSKYFRITETEKKFNNSVSESRKKIRVERNSEVVKSIYRLSESKRQEVGALKFLKENQDSKFIGKTNKKNLVFEKNNNQIKISIEGNIL